jgi:hypothetical protein
VISHSEILRAIGQDLELRGMKTFDIRSEGQNVLVQCGYQKPPAPMPVTLQYTPAVRGSTGFLYSLANVAGHRRLCRTEKGPVAPGVE